MWYGGAALVLSLVGWRAQDYINVLQTGEEDDDHNQLDPSCADHSPLSAGGATLGLHGGGFQSDAGGGGGFGGGSTFFNYANGQFLNGLLTVAYELETVRKGEGGFACVAGCER